jgi:hypothetical protein
MEEMAFVAITPNFEKFAEDYYHPMTHDIKASGDSELGERVASMIEEADFYSKMPDKIRERFSKIYKNSLDLDGNGLITETELKGFIQRAGAEWKDEFFGFF